VNISNKSLDHMIFSPDGHLVAANDGEGAILLWDVAQRHPLPVTIKGACNTLAFSRDGERLISISQFGEVEFHDLRLSTWQALACQRANRNLTRAEWEQYLPGEPYRPTCPDLPVPEE
jgi:WD40 repeat protein